LKTAKARQFYGSADFRCVLDRGFAEEYMNDQSRCHMSVNSPFTIHLAASR
jgi:hypothetical protein